MTIAGSIPRPTDDGAPYDDRLATQAGRSLRKIDEDRPRPVVHEGIWSKGPNHDIPGEHSGQLDRPKGNRRQRGGLEGRDQGDEPTYEPRHGTMDGGEAKDKA
jgi:hypothetical protein